ncbi:transcription antitermination factor NusB [Lentibacillus sp. CBA3610]|uniref:transcription antitermination factor NusB n=1 Tax=Lentibacillus sp. CBA3610 TaxID=2518176 RepID=UPI001595B44F|nr:transcription antitermination factor NusB [Lentibacillus sp. CBA3610]QKY69296.1 transcription antitermination factor NusB [Lentibacillus sp. CBA3610]
MNRHAAREKAMQILFQLDMNDKHPEEAIEEQLESLEVDSYLQSLVEGVAEYKSRIDNTIAEHLENWTIDRIASVEKTVLRIAVFELNYREDIPVNVSINEAVELAGLYGDEKSGKFVNGVLSKIIA